MGSSSRPKAFKKLFRGLVAGVGLTLVVSTVAAPVQAHAAEPVSTAARVALVDGVPILGGLIKPATSGSGSVTCSVTSPPTKTCTDSFTAFDLLGTTVELVPVPASGYEFDGWTSGCPSQVGDACVIGSSALTQVLQGVTGPLEPVATFIPVDEGIPCTPVPLPGCEEPPAGDAPQAKITKAPEAETMAVNATFEFEAAPAPAEGTDVAFECRLEGPSQAHDFTACASARSYTALEPGLYTFSVHTVVDGEPSTTDDDHMWKITEEESDTSAPQTSITEHPRIRRGGWLLQSFAGFKFASDQKGASFRCGLDGDLRSCTGGQVVYRTVSSSTHTFSVAASAGDRADRTPAKMTFTVPKNNNKLRHSKADRSWTKKQGRGYFLNTYSETSTKGAWVAKGSRSIKKIALVATKGPGHGTLKVFLGKQLLKKVSLQAKRTRKSQLIPIETFRTKKRGAVRVVVVSRNKTVRIEGLGIATR